MKNWVQPQGFPIVNPARSRATTNQPERKLSVHTWDLYQEGEFAMAKQMRSLARQDIKDLSAVEALMKKGIIKFDFAVQSNAERKAGTEQERLAKMLDSIAWFGMSEADQFAKEYWKGEVMGLQEKQPDQAKELKAAVKAVFDVIDAFKFQPRILAFGTIRTENGHNRWSLLIESPWQAALRIGAVLFDNRNPTIFGAALSAAQTLISGGAISMAEVELLLERYQPKKFEEAMGRPARPFDENGNPVDTLGLSEGAVAPTPPAEAPAPEPVAPAPAEDPAPEPEAEAPPPATEPAREAPSNRAARHAGGKAAKAKKAAGKEARE